MRDTESEGGSKSQADALVMEHAPSNTSMDATQTHHDEHPDIVAHSPPQRQDEEHELEPLKIWNRVKFGRIPETGFRYVIIPNVTPPERVEAHLEVKVGSTDETDDEQGLAHYLEHAVFLGTTKYPSAEHMRQLLSSWGMSFGGDVNAYTDFRQTVFTLSIPYEKNGDASGDANADVTGDATSKKENKKQKKEEKEKGRKTGEEAAPATSGDNLYRVIDVLHELAFEATLKQEFIDAERGAVLSEAQSANSVELRAELARYLQTHSDTKLPHRFPIGLEEQIKRFSADDLSRFYRKHYVPRNMTLYVVGDVDVATTEKYIREVFAEQLPEVEDGQRAAAAAAAAVGGSEDWVTWFESGIRSNGLVRQFPPQTSPLPVVIYQHPLVKQVSYSLCELRPLCYYRKRKDFADWLAISVIGNIFASRISAVRQSSRDPPFTAIEWAHELSYSDNCLSNSIDIECGAQDWKAALLLALKEVKRLVVHGITEQELSHHLALLLRQIKQRVEQEDTQSSIEVLENVMGELSQGNLVLSDMDEYVETKRVIDCRQITLSFVHAMIKDLFAFVDRFTTEITTQEHREAHAPSSSSSLPSSASPTTASPNRPYQVTLFICAPGTKFICNQASDTSLKESSDVDVGAEAERPEVKATASASTTSPECGVIEVADIAELFLQSQKEVAPPAPASIPDRLISAADIDECVHATNSRFVPIDPDLVSCLLHGLSEGSNGGKGNEKESSKSDGQEDEQVDGGVTPDRAVRGEDGELLQTTFRGVRLFFGDGNEKREDDSFGSDDDCDDDDDDVGAGEDEGDRNRVVPSRSGGGADEVSGNNVTGINTSRVIELFDLRDKVHVRQLSNGVRVVFKNSVYERHQCTLLLSVRGGTCVAPYAGVSILGLSSLCQGGVCGFNTETLAQYTGLRGISIVCGCEQDTLHIQVACSVKDGSLERAFEALFALLTYPDWGTDAFERVKKDTLLQEKQFQSNVGAKSLDELNKVMFETCSPNVGSGDDSAAHQQQQHQQQQPERVSHELRFVQPTREMIRTGIPYDLVKYFVQSHIDPRNMELLIVGDCGDFVGEGGDDGDGSGGKDGGEDGDHGKDDVDEDRSGSNGDCGDDQDSGDRKDVEDDRGLLKYSVLSDLLVKYVGTLRPTLKRRQQQQDSSPQQQQQQQQEEEMQPRPQHPLQQAPPDFRGLVGLLSASQESPPTANPRAGDTSSTTPSTPTAQLTPSEAPAVASPPTQTSTSPASGTITANVNPFASMIPECMQHTIPSLQRMVEGAETSARTNGGDGGDDNAPGDGAHYFIHRPTRTSKIRSLHIHDSAERNVQIVIGFPEGSPNYWVNMPPPPYPRNSSSSSAPSSSSSASPLTSLSSCFTSCFADTSSSSLSPGDAPSISAHCHSCRVKFKLTSSVLASQLDTTATTPSDTSSDSIPPPKPSRTFLCEACTTRRAHPKFVARVFALLTPIVNNRLFRDIREKQGLLYNVTFEPSLSSVYRTGPALLFLTSFQGQVDTTITESLKILKSIKYEHDITEKDFKEALQPFVAGIRSSLHTNSYWQGVLMNLTSPYLHRSFLTVHDIDGFYASLQLQDIFDVMDVFFNLDNMCVSIGTSGPDDRNAFNLIKEMKGRVDSSRGGDGDVVGGDVVVGESGNKSEKDRGDGGASDGSTGDSDGSVDHDELVRHFLRKWNYTTDV